MSANLRHRCIRSGIPNSCQIRWMPDSLPDFWEVGLVVCRNSRMPELAAGLLGGRNSSDAGTCCRTLGRPELVGLRNSSMPELVAGLLGGRNSSDSGTRQCRNSLPDSWEAGTRRTPELVNAGTRCRTLGRPELVGRRNSSMPELAAGLLGGRTSSDSGTRQCRTLGCRNSSLNRSLLSSRITSFNQPLSSDFSLIWPVGSPYIGRAKLAGTRRMEGVSDDDGLHDETVLTKRV